MINHVLNRYVKGNYEHLIGKLDALAPTERWLVTVIPYKSKRTTDQNSRLWDLYTAIGRYIGDTPDHVHELMGYKFLRELKTINGEVCEVIKSTTKLNTAQMVEYQDAIEMWAAEIGFVWEER